MRHAVMSQADLQRVTDRFIASINGHDAAALAALYAADCAVESPFFSALQGRAMVEESFRQWFAIFPDCVVTIESMIVDPPRVATAGMVTATHEGDLFGLPPTHKKVEFRIVLLTEIEDGLITRERRVYDFTGLLVQVGVLRAKPAKI
jgi:steroid delta-isomerase-like uncharacterized protein